MKFTPTNSRGLTQAVCSAATLCAMLLLTPSLGSSQETGEQKKRSKKDSVSQSRHERKDTVRKPRRKGFDTTQHLSEVVVSASGFEQDKKDAPASITVISKQEILGQRNNSLAELLGEVEGIDVGGTTGKTGGRTIMMRGMPAEYTLILIDGRRQNSAGSVTPNGFGETSSGFLPPIDDIERVEVIRGPMATLYGSDAMGGVINIITKKVAKRWNANLTADQTFNEEKGFGKTFSKSFSTSGPLYRQMLGVSARGRIYNRSASSLTPTGDADSTVTISKRGPNPVKNTSYSLGGRVSFTPLRAHDIWVDYDLSRQMYDNTAGQLGTLDKPGNANGGYGPKQWFNRNQTSAVYAWRFNTTRWESAYTNNSTETIGRTIPPNTPGGLPGSGAPDKIAGSTRELNATNHIFDSKAVTAFGRHMLTVGGQYWDAKMVDGVALAPFTHTQWSLFLENEWRVADPVSVTFGIRRDDHNAFGGQTSPRIYAVWNASRLFTIKGGVSQGFKTPRVDQLADGIVGFTGQGTRATIGSPNLKPETSTATELGFYLRHDNGISANVTVFNNQFKDKIASGNPIPNCTFADNPNAPGCVTYGDFPAQETFGQNINIDKAVTRGGEFAFRAPLNRFTFLSTNYTFTDSKQQSGDDKGAPLVNTPKHMGNAKITSNLTSRLNAWIGGEFKGQRLRRTSVGSNMAYDSLGNYKAYQVFNLGGSFEVTKSLTINATIHNLANKDFLKYGSYASPTVANPNNIAYTSLYNIHEEGRRLWVSTNFKF